MNERFVVRASLSTPVIVSAHYTLDALLAALVFDATGNLESAHEGLPLARTDGVWHGSQAYVEMNETPRSGNAIFTASLRASHDIPVDSLLLARGGQAPRIGAARTREWGNVQNTYPTLDAAALWWFGEGDVARVSSLVASVRTVGKKRTAGYGHVLSVEVDTGAVDGLIDTDGQPMRPIPLSAWRGSPTVLRGDCAWRSPYWDPACRAICAVPNRQAMSRDVLEGWL